MYRGFTKIRNIVYKIIYFLKIEYQNSLPELFQNNHVTLNATLTTAENSSPK